MKSRIFAAVALSLAAASAAQAQSGTQDVTYDVQAISLVSISGATSLTISSATAGGAPVAATGVATYDITTNETGQKITASINSAMPTGLTLSITLAAPTGATSAGSVNLTATPADVVTGIANLSEQALAISYNLAATAAAAVQSGTRTVTLTITAGA